MGHNLHTLILFKIDNIGFFHEGEKTTKKHKNHKRSYLYTNSPFYSIFLMYFKTLFAAFEVGSRYGWGQV